MHSYSDVYVAVCPVAPPDPLDIGDRVNVLADQIYRSVNLLDATELFKRRPQLTYRIGREAHFASIKTRMLWAT